MRRPLFPLALAGLGGTVAGYLTLPRPLLWTGAALGAAVMGWWGPRKLRTPAVWIFTLAVFALYAGARAFAPEAGSLRDLAGEAGGTARLAGWLSQLPAVRIWDNGEQAMEAEMRVESIAGERGWEKCQGKVLLRMDPAPARAPEVGEVIEVAGYLSLPEKPKNPGEFNRVTHLRSQGMDFIFYAKPENVRGTGTRVAAWLARLAAGLRGQMLWATSLGLAEDPEASGIIAAMLFGYRDGVGAELREAFRATGTLHLFAVSGQNLAVVAGILLWVLALAGAVKWKWAWATLPLVFLFCLATGMEASAGRAFVMTSVLYLGWIVGRPMDSANWLGAALLALLLWDPRQVEDAGFQLSFLVVAALMTFAGPWQSRLVGWGKLDPWIPVRLVTPWRRVGRRIWVVGVTLVAASAAAWVGSLLPAFLLFHQITPVALAANVVAAPVAGAVTAMAAVSALVATVFPLGAIGVNLINARLVHLLASVLGWMATWPGGHFAVADPRAWFPGEPWIKILAVDGSSPTVIHGQGGPWLLEPGSKRAWAESVRPFVNWHGINRWSGVGLMTGLSERMGGVNEWDDAMAVDWWAESGLGGKAGALKKWREELGRKKVGRRFWRAGDEVKLGEDWRVEVLWPPAGSGQGRADEDGIVCQLRCGEARMMWAGSIPAAVERELIAAVGEADLSSGILLQGPAKGGEANLTSGWVQAVHPQKVIRWTRRAEDDPAISVDFDRQMGEMGSELIQLRRSGCVRLRPNRTTGQWEVETYLQPERRSVSGER